MIVGIFVVIVYVGYDNKRYMWIFVEGGGVCFLEVCLLLVILGFFLFLIGFFWFVWINGLDIYWVVFIIVFGFFVVGFVLVFFSFMGYFIDVCKCFFL